MIAGLEISNFNPGTGKIVQDSLSVRSILDGYESPDASDRAVQVQSPESMKEVKVYRGALAPGVTAQLSLMIDGPGFQEPICVDSHTLCLDAALKTWPVRLAYNHLELVPGEYTYWVTMDVDQRRVVSALVRYELKPFTFGV